MPLAPYAVHSASSAGRRYPEAPHPYRTDFERDRARVIHARAFRRLEDKTQVFTDRANDHFRNRLTHTIEVAQLSRTVAQALDLNPDLAETLALVHDIGHPPFGHAGERRLDELMRAAGEAGFDHNLQALRTVEYIENAYPAFRGLNLTFEGREGIIKHSRDWNVQRNPELQEYRLEERPPLEAQLIDITDEIAYSTADIDDGVEAGLLTVEQICDAVPIFRRTYEEVQSEYPCIRQKVCLLETIKRVLDRSASDLIATSARNLEQSRVHSLHEVRHAPARLVALSPEIAEERANTKGFLYDTLYYSPSLKRHKEHGEQVIAELFGFFMAHADRLPSTYRQMAGLEPMHPDEHHLLVEPLPRIVCDYIAGMTDSYCLEQHRRFVLS